MKTQTINDCCIDIVQPLLEYAEHIYQNFVPLQRKSGFTETKHQYRGEGDFLDLLGALVVFDELGKNNKVCSLELVCGKGDEGDIGISIDGIMTTWNVKTSQYAPYRSGLRLFVKQEELTKETFGYIQCFVHLDEDDHPHVHIAGACRAHGQKFQELSKPDKLKPIPKTGGHMGVHFPVEELASFEILLEKADTKF